MTTPARIADLMADEGLRRAAYRDTVGVCTIGYGHTPASEGEVWTVAQAYDQLIEDVAAVTAGLDRDLAWWRTLDEVRQDALANMGFNLGVHGLLGFTHMLAPLQAGDFAVASAQMLLSKWASQVGDRAARLAAMIRTGLRP